MKIVVYGPDKRTGALHDGNVVDLSDACAKYLRECTSEPRPLEMAQALVPPDLSRLIEGGPRALEYKRRSTTFFARNRTNSDRGAKSSSTRPRMCGCMRRGRTMPASPALAGTSPTTLRQWP